ncbi:hypothetical protein PIIN_01248 [Serendipita indica DSM 11827]|uniref:Uncharacterized protein n=1 Tax=Serendipita indica (strain DSM 11827) TaxID=1109443 RepID=G4T7R6_SERID|nr:hypothetical protein PIIN_01248 [Serendipita indica DSM 11827]
MPAKEWPSDIKNLSQIYQTALLHQSMFQGQTLMCHPGSTGFHETTTWMAAHGSDDRQPFSATFFSKFMEPLNIDKLRVHEMDKWARLFHERVQDGVILENMMHCPEQARSVVRSAFKSQETQRGSFLLKKLWILVCTHAARDCRCGQHGAEVIHEFRQEVQRRNLQERINIGEVSHVGGHAFAANVLVYPYGDWYGTMRLEHVSPFLDSLLGVEEQGSLTGPQSLLWRGSWFDVRGELNEYPSQQKQQEVAKEWGMDLDAITRGD